MPFIARQQSTGSRIDAFTYEGDIKADFDKGDLVCPYCGEVFLPIREHYRDDGEVFVNQHFKHPADVCSSEYEAHGETMEHIAFKRIVRDRLVKKYAHDEIEASVEFEVPIDMEWRTRGRIADVLVTYPTGWQEAHEIQLSPITVDEFVERTEDYERSGIEVIWYLGEKNTQNNNVVEWFKERFGGYTVAEVSYANRDNFNRAHQAKVRY